MSMFISFFINFIFQRQGRVLRRNERRPERPVLLAAGGEAARRGQLLPAAEEVVHDVETHAARVWR